jgi:hypothetical protein
METKSVKQRLDELEDLLESNYITENEYRIARVNILKEDGVDLVLHSRPQEAEPRRSRADRSGCGGCGCFLTLSLLTILIGAGFFFAAPGWPQRFGGDYARRTREWTVELWEGLFGLKGSVAPVLSPSLPLSSDPLEAVTSLVSMEAPVVSMEAPVSSETVPSASQPFPDGGVLPLPSVTVFDVVIPGNVRPAGEKPKETIIEISSTLSADPPDFEKEALRQGFVSAYRARMRDKPDTSTNTNVIGWRRKGERFSVLGERKGRDGNKWYRVRFESGERREGWISSTLVTLK